MPHDKNGQLVKEGDRVTVEFVVKSIMAGEDFCNATMESVIPMLPSGGPCSMTINAGQCELVSEMEAEEGPSLHDTIRESVEAGIEEVKRHVATLIKNLTPATVVNNSAPLPPPVGSSASAVIKKEDLEKPAVKGNGFEVRGHAILRLDPPAKKP